MLIVDDETAILTALSRYFTRLGFSVDCATELEEAEAMLVGNGSYDIVISDLALADAGSTEGLEFVRFVRHHAPLSKVVMLTGRSSASIEREARRRGADAFLEKPASLAEIAAVAMNLVGGAAAAHVSNWTDTTSVRS